MKQQTQTDKIEWREVELKELLNYEQPANYIVASTDYKDKDKTPVLTAGKSFILGYTNEITGIYDKLPVIIFDDFTTDTKFVNFKFKVKSSAMKMLTAKNDLINLKFVFLMMQGIRANSVSHKRYYLSIYQNKKIPFPFLNGKPDLKEQERIVKILEKAETLKQKGKKAEDLLNEYLKSVFYEMFFNKGYEEKKLGDICIKITDGSHRTPKLLNEGYSFLTVANMDEIDFDYVDCKKISKRDYVDLVKNACRPENGDVLFSKDGTVGKVMRINKTKEQVVLSSIAILKPDTKILNSLYLEYILKTEYILNQAISRKSGSAIRRIILAQLKQIEIPLPPLPLQQKFAKIVEQVEKMKENVKKTKQNSEELFNSLMQKAFRGEL